MVPGSSWKITWWWQLKYLLLFNPTYLGKWSTLTIIFFQMGCNHQLDSHLDPQSPGGLVQMIFLFSWVIVPSFWGVVDLEGVCHTPKRTMKMGIQHFCSFERWGSFDFFLLFVFQGNVYCWKNCGVFLFRSMWSRSICLLLFPIVVFQVWGAARGRAMFLACH